MSMQQSQRGTEFVELQEYFQVFESLRRIVRRTLGWDSWPYRMASSLCSELAVLLSEGPRTLIVLRRLRRMPPNGTEPVSVRFRRLQHPFLLRSGTNDIGTAINNFVRSEYGQFNLKESPLTMIDGGAYIGDTTAYFLSRFPDLRCIAVEPNPESLRLAQKNLAPYDERVTLLPYALSISEEPVKISGAETGTRINDTDGIEVQATTIPKLLDRFPDRHADILKLDIEGAEDGLFRAHPEMWLPQIDCIIIETHGPEITRNVLGVLESNGWVTVHFRNLYYCQRDIKFVDTIRERKRVAA